VSARREPPSNLSSLGARIRNAAKARGSTERRLLRAVSNVVVGQMIPPSVVKGGTAMKLRVGESGSRFTPDFDVTRHARVSADDYLDDLRDRLAAGWGDFTGTVQRHEPASPDGVPEEYVMQPFSVKLSYAGREWLKVVFELGHDEIGSTSVPEHRIADELVALFADLGLPEPDPIPVLAVEHQVAQKLHACTTVSPKTGANERAHDLVDLQLLAQEETFDLARLRPVCERLFRARQSHAWPPEVVVHDRWADLYADAADGLGVIADVHEAVAWANKLIHDLDDAS